MKNILITGAAGFLGSHLCDRFLKEGYHVIGMDNFITGDKKNIHHLINHPSTSTYMSPWARRKNHCRTMSEHRHMNTGHLGQIRWSCGSC